MVTYGKETAQVFAAAESLYQKGLSVRIIKLFRVFPVKEYASFLSEALNGIPRILFAEEGIETGGIAHQIVSELALMHCTPDFCIRAVSSEFLPHGSYDYLLRHCRLDAESLAEDALSFVQKHALSK